MAKRDFDLEFRQIEKQYFDMLQTLRDMEEEFANGMVAPETYEQLKTLIQPVMTNYKMWSYVKYVLDKPAKKKKVTAYNRQTKKLQEHMKTFAEMSEENQKVLDELAEYRE